MALAQASMHPSVDCQVVKNVMSVRQYIRWLYGLSTGQRCRLTLRIAAGVARVVVTLAFVWLCKQMVDIAVSTGSSMPLWPFVWALAGCVAVQLVLGAVISRIGVSLTARIANRLRLSMFDRSMRALYGRSLHSADIIERMRKDTDMTADLVSVAIPDVIVTLFQLFAAFAFLASLDWRLALVMVSIMPLALLFGKAFLRRMRRLSSRIRQLDSSVNRHVQEHLRHRYVDAAFQTEKRTVSQTERFQMRLFRLIMRRNNYSLFSRMMIQAGFSAGYLTAFVWGVYGLSSGAVTFGVMTAFLQLVSQVQRPAIELAHKLPGFVYGIASAERIVAVTEAPVEEEATVYTPLPAAPAGIRMEDVTFCYEDGEEPVINRLSALFGAGRMTAVTGLTGAGKTTLLRLLMAFVRPVSGRLIYFGSDGSEAEVSVATRSLITYVPQGNTLLSATIRGNLAMARPDASEEDMKRALETACCDFVSDLPAGLDTRVGEGGAKLSEGQAQRIAIARGLLRDRPVVLLDEPTSALDPDTESRLMANLAALTPGHTIVIITHRMPTASACDARIALR